MLNIIRQKLYILRRELSAVFLYTTLSYQQHSYDYYWSNRSKSSPLLPNFFHVQRASILSKMAILPMGRDVSSLFDIGSGDGRQLQAISSALSVKLDITASDVSDISLSSLSNKFKTSKITDKLDYLNQRYDLITAFEVLEHLSSPEEVFHYVLKHTNQFHFSVPNTGFITYRIRLLFGKFPIQWRSFPGEHVRFWTYLDMQWWLSHYLSIPTSHFKIILYPTNIILELFPFLKPIFCKGLYVIVSPKSS